METNTNVWLDTTLHTGACGTWWSAETAGGQRLGLLQLEPALLAPPAVKDRVAATVAAVRASNPPGVVRTTELVVDARRAWLVVAVVPTPTLRDLLAARPALAPGALAGLALDVATALRDLHAVGLAHGDLSAATVVLTAGGRAALVEVGLLAAVQGRPTDLGADVAAWAALARDLAGAATDATERAHLTRAGAWAATGRLARDVAGLPEADSRDTLVPALSGIAPARVVRPRPPADDQVASAGAGIRLRFGPGIPAAAIAASEAAAAATPAPRRGGWRGGWRVAVAVLAALLVVAGVGLAVLLLRG